MKRIHPLMASRQIGGLSATYGECQGYGVALLILWRKAVVGSSTSPSGRLSVGEGGYCAAAF